MYPIHLTVYGLCMNGKNFPIFSEIILASDIFWNFYFGFTNKIYTHRNLECICLVRNNEFIVMSAAYIPFLLHSISYTYPYI